MDSALFKDKENNPIEATEDTKKLKTNSRTV